MNIPLIIGILLYITNIFLSIYKVIDFDWILLLMLADIILMAIGQQIHQKRKKEVTHDI